MIIEQAMQILKSGKGLSLADLTDRIPDLAGRDDAGELLYLLLRLDRRFEKRGTHWFTWETPEEDDKKIVTAAKAYFKSHPRGDLLKHMIPAVIEMTGASEERIRKVILSRFQNIKGGQMVLNRVKENEDGEKETG